MIRIIFELVALFLLVWFAINLIVGKKDKVSNKIKQEEQRKKFKLKKLSGLLERTNSLKSELDYKDSNRSPIAFEVDDVARKLQENIDLVNMNEIDIWYTDRKEKEINELDKDISRMEREIAKIK
jgi:cell division protein FtsB